MARTLVPSVLLALTFASAAAAQVRLADISRIKGQEDNELIGTGLIVGLPGDPRTVGVTLRMNLRSTR